MTEIVLINSDVMVNCQQRFIALFYSFVAIIKKYKPKRSFWPNIYHVGIVKYQPKNG